MPPSKRLRKLIITLVPLIYVSLVAVASAIGDLRPLVSEAIQDAPRQTVDPAAWGGNHAGKPIPEVVRGDECLFCHRNDIGTTWQKNAHGVTLRQREDAPELSKLLQSQPSLGGVASQVQFFLGSRRHVRFLKKEGYGKLSLLSAHAILRPDRQLESLQGRRQANLGQGPLCESMCGLSRYGGRPGYEGVHSLRS